MNDVIELNLGYINPELVDIEAVYLLSSMLQTALKGDYRTGWVTSIDHNTGEMKLMTQRKAEPSVES